MSQFDTNKWFKKQYLKEAGIVEEEKLPMPSPAVFYAIHEILKNFLDEKAIEAGDRMSYFSAEFPLSSYFESYMRKQLEGSQLTEAPGSSLNLSKDDMDKLHKDGELEIDGHKISFKTQESIDEAESTDIERLDFAFVDGTTKLYAVYVYKKGGRGAQWDKKLSRKEAQELLDANDINIEINPYNIDKIDDALKDIKVTQSEFDVS